jgi:mRNA-degrading endonuclease RelE of RelBE toxin-antitoxin system
MAAGFKIELSEVAEKVYKRLYEEARECLERKDETNSKVKQFRMVEEALDKIIPHDPFAPERSLSGALAGIYRVKKGRIRICYVGSSANKQITILYISDTPRKAGDARDPYRVFTRMIQSGKFEKFLDPPGVHKPSKKTMDAGQWGLPPPRIMHSWSAFFLR